MKNHSHLTVARHLPGKTYPSMFRSHFGLRGCLKSPVRLPLPHSRFWFSSLFSFLVAGSATELFGSMGRTKDRVSPFTQGSSNNALLEVIAQLRQQNQELLDRLASQHQQSVNGSVMAQARHTPATFSDAPSVHPAADSTWETVKAQARHTPATNTIASMVHPAADAAWKTKKTKSGPARDTSAKVIIQDGWSVPVVHSFEEFWLADTGPIHDKKRLYAYVIAN